MADPTLSDDATTRRRFLTAAAISGGALAVEATVPSLAAAAPWFRPASLPGLEQTGRTGQLDYWPEHPFYSFALTRLIGKSISAGADTSEAWVAAREIGDSPSSEACVRVFTRLGRALAERSRELSGSDPVAARAAALRATQYLYTAEFFVQPQGPDLQRKVALYREIRRAFAAGVSGALPRVEPVEVPYERTGLYAYYVHPERRLRGRHPAVVFFGGMDSVGEECYFWIGSELARRGVGVLIVDGPGNGASLLLRNIHSRPDYEVAGTAAYEYLASRPSVDPDRIGLIGISLGGYYAARSAAFEHRYRATVVWGAIWNVMELAQRQRDPDIIRFLLQQGLWVFGGNNPVEAARVSSECRMDGAAQRIRKPIFILHGEDDHLAPVDQAHTLYEAIRAPKVLHIVPSGRPGSTHVQVDSLPAAWEAMLPWLGEQLDAPRL